jgi:hypothetical protein
MPLKRGVKNMSKNKVIKSVAFNITVEDDVKILKAVKRRNFSGYVKKLILADINHKEQIKTENKAIQESTTADKFKELADKLKKPGTTGQNIN